MLLTILESIVVAGGIALPFLTAKKKNKRAKKRQKAQFLVNQTVSDYGVDAYGNLVEIHSPSGSDF